MLRTTVHTHAHTPTTGWNAQITPHSKKDNAQLRQMLPGSTACKCGATAYGAKTFMAYHCVLNRIFRKMKNHWHGL